MSILIKNIKVLAGVADTSVKRVAGKEMANLITIEDAFLLIENDIIKDFGKTDSSKIANHKSKIANLKEIDANGKFVLPCWCDSHTHLVYAASRENEFVDRIKGLTYEDIAKRGGGILNSIKSVHAASEDQLVESALQRLNEIMMQGTGAVEIKSGYGLNTPDELKMLRVIKKLKTLSPLAIKATFLGAHAIPPEFKNNKKEYIRIIKEEMMPRIAEEELADYCDVFCERNYFTKDETKEILEHGLKYGMKPKVHAEQLSHSGGIQAGVECGAISVDHLEYCSDEDILALKDSETMPTILPGAQFFLGLQHPPARRIIDSGLPLAIASDYNPGSNPTGNMNLMIALACIQYKLTPEEAINAATINSAYAMNMNDTHGSITIGKKANVFITKEIPSLAFLPYSFGSNLIQTVLVNGKIQSSNN